MILNLMLTEPYLEVGTGSTTPGLAYQVTTVELLCGSFLLDGHLLMIVHHRFFKYDGISIRSTGEF
jgi:hypothetical protein